MFTIATSKTIYEELRRFVMSIEVNEDSKILIKPNLVWDKAEHPEAVLTSGWLIERTVKLLRKHYPSNEIVIADAPQMDTDFKRVLKQIGVSMPILDLRKMRAIVDDNVVVERFELYGDPLGYTEVDLGRNSFFSELNVFDNLRGSDYDDTITQNAHSKNVNKYLIANTLLTSDIVINMPKMKVHKKAGVTLNAKNFIGISGDKNYIPHYRYGEDEYPEKNLKNKIISTVFKYATKRVHPCLLRRFSLLGEKIVYRGFGDWRGNDTIWRAIRDICNIVFYADQDGKIHKTEQRKVYSILDGIIAGEGEAPLHAEPKKVNKVFLGNDIWGIDINALHYMGFKQEEIPTYKGIKREIVIDEIDPFKRPEGW